MTMPIPTKEERWVWIDCLAFIRAIYLPVAHSVSKDYPQLCSFVQVNFALSRTVKFWHGEGHFKDVKTDAVLGLKRDVKMTLALDVTGLIELLALPRQLRKDNCYNLKLLKLQASASLQPNPGVSKTYSDKPDISWLTETFIRNVLTIGIGFVPGVGPILQIMFSVGWTLVSEEDPEAAFELLKNLCPGIDLTEKMIDELQKTATETRNFLPDGWKELNLKTQQQAVKAETTPKPIEAMDAMLPMILQKEVLDATGNGPDKATPAGSPDEGETLVDNPAGELMDAGRSVIGAVESVIPGI
ncbi:hypothetical protein XANCAGTX0491_007337 [Xanthoria calcicola]